MRILLVMHGTPVSKMGGVGLLVHNLSRELTIQGHDVHILAPRLSKTLQSRLVHKKQEWGELHILETKYFQWSDSWENMEAQSLLSDWLYELQPECCHIHHLSGLPLAFHRLLPQDCRLVITLHDYAIPCARGQMYHREHRICDSNDLKNCLSCLQPFKAKKGAVLRRLEQAKELLFRADHILSPSQDLSIRIQSIYPQLNISSVDLPVFDRVPYSDTRDSTFIFVGSIIPTKGLDLLLKAMLRFPKESTPSLKIIGFSAQYPTWKDYQTHCQKLASLSPSIIWLGEKEHKECLKEMAKAKCLVLPSVWPENSPLTIREASSLGLDIICPNWGGSSELAPQALILKKPSIHQLYQLLQIAEKRYSPHCETWISAKKYSLQLLSIYQLARFK